MRADEIEQANSEHDVLEYLTQYEYLDGAAHGIALQVISKDRESLTEKQKYIFQTFIADKFFHLECKRCHNPMPTCEVVFALAEGDDLCSWCRKMESNDD